MQRMLACVPLPITPSPRIRAADGSGRLPLLRRRFLLFHALFGCLGEVEGAVYDIAILLAPRHQICCLPSSETSEST